MGKGYHDLEVYKRSYALAMKMHKTTQGFPHHEMYELGSQIRRTAVSIPLNIAGGIW